MSISLSVTTVNKIANIWKILNASARDINGKGSEKNRTVFNKAVLIVDESYLKDVLELPNSNRYYGRKY